MPLVNRERRRAYKREYYFLNRESCCARYRKYYYRHRKKILERGREGRRKYRKKKLRWLKEHPEAYSRFLARDNERKRRQYQINKAKNPEEFLREKREK